MLRKLNFTERVKVPRTSVRVTLRREPDGVLAFDPAISLADVAAPPDARVYVEAYHRTSYMRFDCGTVDALSLPNDRRLTEIDGTSIRFRIKIVDAAHRILAVADDVRVTEKSDDGGASAPLLPVQFTSALGQQPWRIAFEPDLPVLELNNRIADIEKLAKDDALFFALVYPAAIREILTRILLIEQHDPLEEGVDWWQLWLRWASNVAVVAAPADPEDAARWIDDVVAAFCSQHRAVDRWNGTHGGPE